MGGHAKPRLVDFVAEGMPHKSQGGPCGSFRACDTGRHTSASFPQAPQNHLN